LSPSAFPMLELQACTIVLGRNYQLLKEILETILVNTEMYFT
jgi:hypothetical protein